MTDYNDGNWHGWNGGECPVHKESEVVVRFRDRNEETEDNDVGKPAYWWAFRHDGGGDDIIAFRVTKVYREPREWWLYGGNTFASFEAANVNRQCDLEDDCGGGEIIHVREVL